jgi:putative chitinase
MQLTLQQLISATGCTAIRASTWLDPINAAIKKWNIDTPRRAAHILAQVSVESAALSRVEENLNYSAERLCAVWPSRFKTLSAASAYARNPEALANRVYGGRMGNTAADDGWRYRGRGLKQLTGKANYSEYAEASRVDVVRWPELLVKPQYAADSAGWFWQARGCNSYADDGDVNGLTRRINGGETGLRERAALTSQALKALLG